ncbi:MAG: N-formylglutamate amidohydrolase [Planctomycetota bacterium]
MGGIRSVPRAVVSVEHASFRVPKHLEHLGLPPAWLETHHGWDPGAALVGRLLARALVVPLHLARWSRLVADVNRSAFHQRVVPATTGGRRVPANQDLDPRDRRERVARYWQPYRDAVESDLDRAVRTGWTVGSRPPAIACAATSPTRGWRMGFACGCAPNGRHPATSAWKSR